jgi:pyruvate dehydrogenase E1 component alpha subunit
MYDPDRYRDKAEIEAWRHRDPITLLGDALRASGGLDDVALETIEGDIAGQIDDAVAFAAASAFEAVEDLERFVTTSEAER